MAIDSVSANAAPQIAGAIRQAASSTGVSFEYLLTTAQLESSLNPQAQASTSTAKGLYQFIDQTWLATMKASGAANGYGQYADAISRTADGRYTVADPSTYAAIMKLRNDPTASATMAGSFTRANAQQLRSAIGRAPTDGELYIAHFLGPDGAARMINAADARSSANAADLFPQAASANPSIFYDPAGHARSVGAVYAKLTSRFEIARAMSFPPSLRGTDTVASAVPSNAAPPSGARPVVPVDIAAVTQAFVEANVGQAPLPLPAMTANKPLFQSMFSDPTRKAVTQTVANLWTPEASESGNGQARPRTLFADTPLEPGKLFGGDRI
jgi:hypothetical protein